MADPNVKRVQFRSYAGPSINVGHPIGPPSGDHVSRAYWLTTKVETGAYFGRVMAYDGTCMTAGPDQHIAVYPKELANEDGNAADDLGSLWGLFAALRSIRGSTPSFGEAVRAIVAELASDGFYPGDDGKPRYVACRKVTVRGRKIEVARGDLVHGNLLRDTYTGPSGGRVPARGPAWEKAERWALLWHRLTVHPDGHDAQLDFGIKHLIHRTRRRRLPGLGTVEEAVYKRGLTTTHLTPALDLAMCVYHAHSVNGPSPANRALTDTLKRRPVDRNPEATARELILRLGNNTYGRWDDDIRNGRYQRTRAHAMASGLWPRDLFEGSDAVMPRDLPG